MSGLLSAQAHVLQALMLRDMRTRFGRSHWGYVAAVLWPFAHILTLIAIMTFRGLPTPLGDSVVLFVTTGCIPFIVFIYLTRKMMESVGTNRSLTFFPQVTILDIVLARAVLEVISSFATLLSMFIFLAALGIDPVPHDSVMAIQAYVATVIFSVGIGVINGCVAIFFPAWVLGWILIIIALYGLSGVYVIPESYPTPVLEYFSWNPMLHCVSMMRAAYYPTYAPKVDFFYPTLVGGCLLLVGLMAERFFVRRTPT